MVDSSRPGLPGPGWYQPDPTVAAWRWWNGVEWTEMHRSDPPRPGAVHQPPLPAGTSTNTWMNWVLVVLPALSLPVALPYLLSLPALLRQSAALQAHPTRPELVPGLLVGVLTSQAGGFLLLAATVVLAWLDWRALRSRGIVQPFHWAWSFLNVVYAVGRQVVVHSRTGRGFAPLWVLIAVYVVSTVGFGVVFVAVFSTVSTAIYHP